MAEAEEGSVRTYDERLARIEAAVEAGSRDLRGLGFWRLLGEAKRDPVELDAIAERAGRIDRAAFEASVPLRFPIWLGNAALLLGTAAGAVGILVAMRAGDDVVAGSALLFAAGAWSVSVHGLAHWAVGRAAGIGFSAYFFRPGQLPPRPGIKTDYATYLRADPARRAVMHAAGAVATKVAPFVALALRPLTNAPGWAAWAVLALGMGQIVTDVVFSTRSGDWSKVRRERAVGRAVATRPYTRHEPGSSGQPG